MADWPGLRRESSKFMASKSRVKPAGHPDKIPPIAGPWDSPKVLNVNNDPNIAPAIM
jgi:hypothetical protein